MLVIYSIMASSTSALQLIHSNDSPAAPPLVDDEDAHLFSASEDESAKDVVAPADTPPRTPVTKRRLSEESLEDIVQSARKQIEDAREKLGRVRKSPHPIN